VHYVKGGFHSNARNAHIACNVGKWPKRRLFSILYRFWCLRKIVTFSFQTCIYAVHLFHIGLLGLSLWLLLQLFCLLIVVISVCHVKLFNLLMYIKYIDWSSDSIHAVCYEKTRHNATTITFLLFNTRRYTFRWITRFTFAEVPFKLQKEYKIEVRNYKLLLEKSCGEVSDLHKSCKCRAWSVAHLQTTRMAQANKLCCNKLVNIYVKTAVNTHVNGNMQCVTRRKASEIF